MIYNKTIKYKVVRLFGEDSEIFKALVNGEKISVLIKDCFNKDRVKVKRFREKRMLYAECKREENNYFINNEKCVIDESEKFEIL